MNSMTGFAYLSEETPIGVVEVDIRGYNNRYLEISVNVPAQPMGLEPRLRALVAGAVARGRVDLSVRLRGKAGGFAAVINEELAEAYWRTLQTLAQRLGSAPPTLAQVLAIEGVLTVERSPGTDVSARIEEIVSRALTEFVRSRREEGERTRADLAGLIEIVKENMDRINALRPEIEAALRSNLIDRLNQLYGEEPQLMRRRDDAESLIEHRLLAETAVLLTKHSVHEEIARVEAHIDAFLGGLQSSEPVGKRLDFICQELNREANTIASKGVGIEASHAVVDMKDTLENIREQVRNVE